MTTAEIPPENVSNLIEQVLKAKDPATVGLKRILRRKEDERNDHPLRSATLEEFSATGQRSKKLTEDELHILELEKKVADLQIAAKQQKVAATSAIQNAYAQGKKEGIAAGSAEGIATTTVAYEKRIDELQRRIGDVLSSFERAKQSAVQNAEHVVLRLCLAMAGKILDREVAADRTIILNVIKRALTYIGHREKMVIRVAPDDLETASQRKDFWVPVGERLEDIAIESDDRIERGGCIVESNSGLVDARLGVQFNELADIIEKTWQDITSTNTGSLPQQEPVPPDTFTEDR